MTSTSFKGIDPEYWPMAALSETGSGGALAVLVKVDGAFFRPVGAIVSILPNGKMMGSLSGGCVDADIAKQALNAKTPTTIRYGEGSAFMDITLPCGAGIDVLILPDPNRTVLRSVMDSHHHRKDAVLSIDLQSYAISDTNTDLFDVLIRPAPRIVIAGHLIEARPLAALAAASGVHAIIYTPDAPNANDTHLLSAAGIDPNLLDDRTAFVCLLHDHDWVTDLLSQALQSSAFYVGCQGGRKVQSLRRLELQAKGIDPSRMYGPIGLHTSARDPRTLAASVFAQIMAEAAA